MKLYPGPSNAIGQTLETLMPERKGMRHWRAMQVIPNAALLRLTIRRVEMTSGTLLLGVVVVLLIGAFPGWPHSQAWGYGPSGSLGLVLAMVLFLWLRGTI